VSDQPAARIPWREYYLDLLSQQILYFSWFLTALIVRDERHPRSTTQAVRCCKELKEVLTTPGHHNSPVIDPEFPSSHEAGIQSLFSDGWNLGYGR